jgi:glyoxylase-like metal-dependent hydrolase (beta-lactamase superfamily II)
MRIHHIDCGGMTPPGGRFLGVPQGTWGAARLACHCLVLELSDRLVLLDTGFGLQDLRDPLRRLGPAFLGMSRPDLDPGQVAQHQLGSLGLRPQDVSDILITHLDMDHAGGLADFPHARVHIAAAEHRAATQPPTRAERKRYRPQQWAHGPSWVTHGGGGEPWMGFEGVKPLPGLGPDILRVPLPGHTRGHCGYAVRGERGWLLHAGDAIMDRRELGFWRHPPVALRAYLRAVAVDLPARKRTRAALARCHQEHGHEVDIVCTHEAAALEERRG